MSETKHWITNLIPVLAFAAGIIISSIGGIISISAALKLAFFEMEPYTIVSKETCEFDYSKAADIPYERTPEEVDQCVAERKAEETERFHNNQKNNIIDGLSALIVGGVLLFVFRKRK